MSYIELHVRLSYREGRTPTSSRTRRAMRLCRFQFSTAMATKSPPMNSMFESFRYSMLTWKRITEWLSHGEILSSGPEGLKRCPEFHSFEIPHIFSNRKASVSLQVTSSTTYTLTQRHISPHKDGVVHCTFSAFMMPIMGKRIIGSRAVTARGMHSVHQYRAMRMMAKPHFASYKRTDTHVDWGLLSGLLVLF